MENALFLEEYNLLAAEPVDMNTAAFTGPRVSMKKGTKLAIIVNMADSAVAATVSFTLKQHNAASAGTSKNLEIANPYYKKVGAATYFTKVAPTVAAAGYDLSTDYATEPGVVVFEILEEDLDVNNNFAWVSIDAADSTQAKLMSVVHVLRGVSSVPAYGQAF